MKKILISAIFLALVNSGPANARNGKEQSISQNYPWLQAEFNGYLAEKILNSRKNYNRLDTKKIVLPKITSMKRSYECSDSVNVQVLSSESPNIAMEVVLNQ